MFERRPREGKLVQDVLSGIIYLAAAFGIIAYVFDLPVQGLLATSGAIAIVLGIALQSNLNDVFSGIVLSLSGPYRPGDWINIEGGTEGRVIETNWRATHVLTSRHDRSRNHAEQHHRKIKNRECEFPLQHPWNHCSCAAQFSNVTSERHKLLEFAILNSRSILTIPRPAVRVVSIDATQTGYELTFFVEQQSSATGAQNELFDLIFRHVTASGAQLLISQVNR